MTINTSVSTITVVGNGATTVFNYNFPVDVASWVQLIWTPVATGIPVTIGPSQFTITGAGPTVGGLNAGGTFTYPLTGSPIAAGDTLKFSRITPPLQQFSFVNQGTVFPADVEQALDVITMALQTLIAGFTPATSVIPLPYASLPAELTNLPICFSFNGQPQSSATGVYPVVQATTLPANIPGSIGWGQSASTGSAVFTLSYVRAGVTTPINTFTFTSASKFGTLGASSAVNLVAGDVLIFVSPASIDATLSNVGFTFLAQRV